MKKHLLALAALATLSGVAAAQSATVYGIVDLSVTSQSNISGGKRMTALTDAVWMPSVFGVTGSEDLGGGLKATFNLESDINADTGALSNASTTANSAASARKLFGRKANVGLTGNAGTLTVGKDIDMIFLQGFIDNIRNSHSASGFVASAIAAYNSFDTDAVFIQNMVRYTTPSYNGLKLSVQHRFGEAAGNSSLNKSDAVLANYNNGGFNLNLGYKKITDVTPINDGLQSSPSLTTATSQTGFDQKLTYVGANYSFDKFKVAATYHNVSNTGTGTNTLGDSKTSELGASYAIQPNLTAAVNYVTTKFDRAALGQSKNYSASLKYGLSKRTNVWGLVSTVKNEGAADITRAVYSIINSDANKTTTAYSVGITHSF